MLDCIAIASKDVEPVIYEWGAVKWVANSDLAPGCEQSFGVAPGVIAAGDVMGPAGLASMAMEHARVAVCHASGFAYKKSTDRLHPCYMLSISEAAWVGLTEEQARARGIACEAYDGLMRLAHRGGPRTAA